MYVGIDHSTTGIKVACRDDGQVTTVFHVDRREFEGSDDIVDRLSEHVDVEDVTLAAVTYAYGNGIAEVTDIDSVTNRGVRDLLGLGYETGAGAAAFDQLQASSVPAVVVPGVHDELETLHPLFKYHSTWSGGDKVASIRTAQRRYREHTDGSGTFIWSCASSSSMAARVCEGRLRGFFH